MHATASAPPSSSSPSATAAPFTTASPLTPRPDQRELWLRHTKPMPFAIAATDVMIQHHLHGARHDVMTSDLRSWAFGSGDGTTMQVVAVPCHGREITAPFGLREHAFRQLCEKVGAPAAYIRELPAKLQIANVNYALSKKATPAMLRIAGGEVRAVLSERYAPIDDGTLFELVDEVLGKAGLRNDAVVRASAVGLSTIMRITLPGEGVAVKRNDVIEFGLDLGNSEVGMRSVQVTPVTYRLVCTNGMRAWQSEATSRFRHIGDPARLRDLLRDAIPVALAEARGDIARWKIAVGRLIDDALAEVESLRSFGITGPDAHAVARSFALDAGIDTTGKNDVEVAELIAPQRSSVFDFANAITATAKTRGVAGRLALEEAGHRYLSARTR